MSDPSSAQRRQHGEDNTTGDPALDAYAHSADQSMGYLETEQLGQTETYGETPHGAYEHGGAMNADADRYTPSSSPDQTRRPDESGQPGAGPWATQPPGSQPPGADEQAMPAEFAAWNPPAVSGPGASATAGQPPADQTREREAAATAGKRRTPVRQGGTMHATDTEQQAPQTPRGRQRRTSQQAQEQQTAPAAPTPEEASPSGGAPAETQTRGRTRKSTAPSDDTSQAQSERGAEAEQPPRRQSRSRAAKFPAEQEQLETAAPATSPDAEATERARAQLELTEPASEGGSGAAEETLQRAEPELQPSGQPVGVQMPTSSNAGALREARTRVDNAIDRFASQIPYGEQFSGEAKRAANQALDRLEAQAADRAASPRRDIGALPDETPAAPA